MEGRGEVATEPAGNCIACGSVERRPADETAGKAKGFVQEDDAWGEEVAKDAVEDGNRSGAKTGLDGNKFNGMDDVADWGGAFANIDEDVAGGEPEEATLARIKKLDEANDPT